MTAKIIQGEDYPLKLTISTSKGECYDMTGYTSIIAKFEKTDGTILSIDTTGISPASRVEVTNVAGGAMTVHISDTDTALLKVGKKQDTEILVTVGDITRIAPFASALVIEAQLL